MKTEQIAEVIYKATPLPEYYMFFLAMVSIILAMIFYTMITERNKKSLIAGSFCILFVASGAAFGNHVVNQMAIEEAKTATKLLLDQESEISLSVNDKGEKRMILVLPEIKEQRVANILGREVVETIVIRPKSSALITDAQLNALIKSDARVSADISIQDLIAKAK